MATLDPTFETRRKAILGNNYTPIATSSARNRVDPTLEARRQQVLANSTISNIASNWTNSIKAITSSPQIKQPSQNFISKAKQTSTNFIDSTFKTAKSITKPITKQVGKILDKPVPKKIALAYAKLSPNEKGREFERKIKSGEVKSISDVFGIPRNITGKQAGNMIEEGLNSLFFSLPVTSSLRGATKSFGDFVKSAIAGGTTLTGIQAGITALKGEKQDVKSLVESFGIGTAFGLTAPKQFPKKGKKITIAPDEAINKVINTDLENTLVGKKIIKP